MVLSVQWLEEMTMTMCHVASTIIITKSQKTADITWVKVEKNVLDDIITSHLTIHVVSPQTWRSRVLRFSGNAKSRFIAWGVLRLQWILWRWSFCFGLWSSMKQLQKRTNAEREDFSRRISAWIQYVIGNHASKEDFFRILLAIPRSKNKFAVIRWTRKYEL